MKNKILAGAIFLLSITTLGHATPIGSAFDTSEKQGTIEIGGAKGELFVHEAQNGAVEALIVVPENRGIFGKNRMATQIQQQVQGSNPGWSSGGSTLRP